MVAKGYTQLAGIEYEDVFAPVANCTTFRFLFAIMVQKGYWLEQMDEKKALQNGSLTKEIYVEKPGGLLSSGEKGNCYFLRKPLYGLKQATRALC